MTAAISNTTASLVSLLEQSSTARTTNATSGDVSEALWLLFGNLTTNISNGDVSNSTHPSSAENWNNILTQWQIILIASLAAAAVVIIIAMVLMWKLCGKKPLTDSGDTSSNTGGISRCCPIWKKGSKLSNGNPSGTFRPASAKKPPSSNEYQQNPEGCNNPLDARAPLPPIGGVESFPVDHNAAMQGAAIVPRRLAPLNHISSATTTTLAGGTFMQTRRTGGVYAPLQQQHITHLKGVPMIPVPMEQRRPLPPTPPTE